MKLLSIGLLLCVVCVSSAGCSGSEPAEMTSGTGTLPTAPPASNAGMIGASTAGSAGKAPSMTGPSAVVAGRQATAAAAGSSASAGAPAAAAGALAAAAGAGGMAGAAGASVSAAGAGGMAGAAGQPASGTCDKPCLIGFMQMYLDAMLSHDPSMLPVSDNLKYTEQGEKAKLGDAVWKTFAEPIAKSRLDFADPVNMNVGTQLGFYESGMTLVRYGLRLKVENSQITEIESMAVRMPDHFAFSADNLEPKPVFLEKPAKPNTREELIAITNLYADYLEGKKQGADLPFAEDCTRYENGVPLAQGKASFEAQSWNFKVEPRRILIIDEEMGITWGNLPFYSDGLGEPLVVGEAFKIVDGEFKMIQAAMRYQNNKEWE